MNDDAALSQLVQWHEAAEQATVDARAESERYRDYYDGKQWTPEEEAALRKRKQPVVTINRIAPKINFLAGQEQQRRSNPKAYPRNPQDEEAANAASDALRFVTDDQKWNRKRSECFDNHIVEGSCGIDVAVYEKRDGDYCIELRPIAWDRMWFDPHSRRRDFSDAKYLGQFLWMDQDEAEQRWPDKTDVLSATVNAESASSSGNTFDDVPRTRWTDPKRKRIRIAECWSREGGKVYYSVFTKGGLLSRMESPYVDEDGDPAFGFVFGSCFVDRDGDRYGPIRNWISIQDEINKRRSKALHLLSVRQTRADRGAVADVNAMKRELAKPDGHIETMPNMAFEVLNTGDMAAAQFSLLQEAKTEIDSVGVNAAMAGTEGRSMSGRALIARQESGLSELGPVFDAFDQFQLDVYRAIWNRIRQFWTAEKWVRVTDDENNLRFVGLNVPMTLGEQVVEQAKQQGYQMSPEDLQQLQADPESQRVVGVKNNVTELDVDITIDQVPASAALQIEQFQTIAEMIKSGVPIPPKALIRASSLRNKEQIIEEMDGSDPANQAHGSQMQQMQDAMQQAQMQIEDMRRKLDEQAAKLEIDAYNAETNRMKAMSASMTPEHVQQLVLATMQQLMTAPDISGGQMPEMLEPAEPPDREVNLHNVE